MGCFQRYMAVVVTALLLMVRIISTDWRGGGEVRKRIRRKRTSPLRLRMSQGRWARSKSRQSEFFCSGAALVAHLVWVSGKDVLSRGVCGCWSGGYTQEILRKKSSVLLWWNVVHAFDLKEVGLVEEGLQVGLLSQNYLYFDQATALYLFCRYFEVLSGIWGIA